MPSLYRKSLHHAFVNPYMLLLDNSLEWIKDKQCSEVGRGEGEGDARCIDKTRAFSRHPRLTRIGFDKVCIQSHMRHLILRTLPSQGRCNSAWPSVLYPLVKRSCDDLLLGK